MNNNIDIIFRKSLFAGFCIGIAGFGYLANPAIGMFLFVFGLITVVKYELTLYTGCAGFIDFDNMQDWKNLIITIVGNILGAWFVSIIARSSNLGICESAELLLQKRLTTDWFDNTVLAVGCGFLMTTAVTFARKSNQITDWLPLLVGVPLFILCGFPHSIADAFYYSCCEPYHLIDAPDFASVYLGTILGNFIGCNIYKLFI